MHEHFKVCLQTTKEEEVPFSRSLGQGDTVHNDQRAKSATLLVMDDWVSQSERGFKILSANEHK